jgi:hypothetical protein
MATTTNYGWTTPDDTDLVKDGAAAIRTLGSSVDTTTKALNPSTTEGDIEYRSATANTNTRLGIGSTGNVLTVAGGVPTWAAPAGGSFTWSLLNTGGTALNTTQEISITGLSAKQMLIFIVGASTNAASRTIEIRPNNDTTAANYALFGTQNAFASAYDGINFKGLANDFGSGFNRFRIAQQGTDAGDTVSGSLFIDSADSTSWKRVQGVGGSTVNVSDSTQFTYNGLFKATGAITSITIRSSAGTFDAGTAFIYGAN